MTIALERPTRVCPKARGWCTSHNSHDGCSGLTGVVPMERPLTFERREDGHVGVLVVDGGCGVAVDVRLTVDGGALLDSFEVTPDRAVQLGQALIAAGLKARA